jgi:hypothetical protein
VTRAQGGQPAVTPTLVAFWLAVLDAAQWLACASEKRKNVVRLWWKLAEIAPLLFVAQVVQQANGNLQALADLRADSAKERVVDKARIRELRDAVGVRYFDFTPVMIVGGGLGDRGARSGQRRRRHRAVPLCRDAGGGGSLDPGVPVSGGGQGE